MTAPIIVDATDANGDLIVIVAGSVSALDLVLTKDGGAVYDLTGKNVQATIREEGAPDVVVGATLEDQTATPGGGTTTAALGGARVSLSTAQTVLLAAASTKKAQSIAYYLVQAHVVTDSYFATQLLRFGVRRAID